MPILRPKPSDLAPNNTPAPTAPKSLSQHYREQWDIKLNKYNPSDKTFILANLQKRPLPEIINSFVKSVSTAAEEEFDKSANPKTK